MFLLKKRLKSLKSYCFRTENQDSGDKGTSFKSTLLNGTNGSGKSSGSKQSRVAIGAETTVGGGIPTEECNGSTAHNSDKTSDSAVSPPGSEKIKINGNSGSNSGGSGSAVVPVSATNGTSSTNGSSAGGKMAVDDGSNNNGIDSIPCA